MILVISNVSQNKILPVAEIFSPAWILYKIGSKQVRKELNSWRTSGLCMAVLRCKHWREQNRRGSMNCIHNVFFVDSKFCLPYCRRRCLNSFIKVPSHRTERIDSRIVDPLFAVALGLEISTKAHVRTLYMFHRVVYCCHYWDLNLVTTIAPAATTQAITAAVVAHPLWFRVLADTRNPS